jgi:hypothetical protein
MADPAKIELGGRVAVLVSAALVVGSVVLGPGLLPLALTLVLVAAYYAGFVRMSRRGPASFRVSRRPGFAAPVPPVRGGGWAIVLTLLAATGLSDDENWLFAVGWALLAAWLLLRPAYLTLTPDGVRVGSLRPKLVPWDALTPDGPWPPPEYPRRLRTTMRLPVEPGTALRGLIPAPPKGLEADDEPDTPYLPIETRAVLADQEFVTFALRHYRANSLARRAIGTPDELSALVTASEAALNLVPAHERKGRPWS